VLQIGYSAPTQAGITQDLQLTLSQVRAQLHTQTGSSTKLLHKTAITVIPFDDLQYSVFGSILTIGAMIGAVASGSIADVAGRKGVYLSMHHS
jgi:SP family facilitated glucose transporter-like MFS transporter 8